MPCQGIGRGFEPHLPLQDMAQKQSEMYTKTQIEGLNYTAVSLMHTIAKSGFPYAQEIYDAYVEMFNPVFDGSRGLVDPQTDFAPRSEVLLNALEKTDIKQVVEFGAGWSTHGLYLCKQDPNFKYIEVLYKDDKLGINEGEQKCQVLAKMDAKIGGIPENYITIGGDALDEKTFEQVAQYLDPARQVAVTNVGLMTYFTDEQKVQYATLIKNLLQEFGGKWITQDVRASKPTQHLAENLTKQTGIANTFGTEEQISDLIGKIGMRRSFVTDETVVSKLTKIGREEKQARNFASYSVLELDEKQD